MAASREHNPPGKRSHIVTMSSWSPMQHFHRLKERLENMNRQETDVSSPRLASCDIDEHHPHDIVLSTRRKVTGQAQPERDSSQERQQFGQTGAVKSKYTLPVVQRQSSLSKALRFLTISPSDERTIDMEEVSTRRGRQEDRRASTVPRSRNSHRMGDISTLDDNFHQPDPTTKSRPLIPQEDKYSTNVANWNIIQYDSPLATQSHDVPAPLKCKKGAETLGKT